MLKKLQVDISRERLQFLICFWLLHILIFIIGWWKQATDERLSSLNALNFSVWISRGAGLVLSVDATIILLPMCRTITTVLRPISRWLSPDDSSWVHQCTAYSLLFWTIVHVSAHYVNFFNVERYQVRPEAAVQIHYTQAGGITGHVMLFCMLLMFTSAHSRIRQQSFEVFRYTHYLYIPFFLALYTHATGCFVRDSTQPISPFGGKKFWDHCLGYEGWRWELCAAALYIFGRVFEGIRAMYPAQITNVILHPCDALELQFTKPGFRYKPGQWLYIQVPDVSSTQWHPFTITSCPFDDYVSIHIRQVGDWTRALGNRLGCGPDQIDQVEGLEPGEMHEIVLMNGQTMPKIRIEGPYGALAEDVFQNEVVVIIGTGIGVTPWTSILKTIWHIRRSPRPPERLRRVEFIWICRDPSNLGWFRALLSALESQAEDEAWWSGDRFLNIHIYVTKQFDQDTAMNIFLNSVGEAHDPVTELRTGTKYGRPNFQLFFEAIRDGLEDQTYVSGLEIGAEASLYTEVGVYYCGNPGIDNSIRRAAKACSTRDIRFRFFKEGF